MFAFTSPHVDYHALAPEIILASFIVLAMLVDLLSERNRALISTVAGIGLLASMIPVLTLAVDGTDRSMFGGAYVVDNFALVFKALFLAGGYVVVLLSTNYIAEGDYYEGEYYFLLLSSILGMTVMGSSRDLITIFVALETLSIPAYMLAAWRKRDLRSDEAGAKYYLMGVFASAVMLYGMSLVFGVTGTTVLSEINTAISAGDTTPVLTLGILFTLIGFGFKISAVPFHTWAPDTYEGAPTPVTAFLSVSSKAAGFVGLITLLYVGFGGRSDVWQPLMWVLATLTMFVGNLIALRQTNVVRMLAYSGIAQAGYILAPLSVIGLGGDSRVPAEALEAVVIYLLIYTVMNLGAFAVVITAARKTRSADIESFNGLFEYAPGLTVAMTGFLFSLAGIPFLAGWFGKLELFKATVGGGDVWAYVMAVIIGVNSVIALVYYARIAQAMWMHPAPDGDLSRVRIPPALSAAMGICLILVVVGGAYPGPLADLGNMATFAFTG
jgi:NADH-quinone oxidoreductase subunit N